MPVFLIGPTSLPSMLWTWGDIVPTTFAGSTPTPVPPPTAVSSPYTPEQPEYVDHIEAALDRLPQYCKPEDEDA